MCLRCVLVWLVCSCCRQFFSAYNSLLRTSSFVVQVSAFQLLSTLLFERSNHDVMMKYVNDPDNLRLAMMQLKNPNRNLQLAVFHVLKIFVPNPYKADSIVRILTNNKQRFLAFLAEFEKDTSQCTDKTHTHTHTRRAPGIPHRYCPLTPSLRCVAVVLCCAEDDVLVCHKREMVDAFLSLDDTSVTSSGGGRHSAPHRRSGSGQSMPAV